MREFIDPDRYQTTFLPPSIDDWLPKKHLARFVYEISENISIKIIENTYENCGKPAYSPRLMIRLLFYGYATGVFSSRKIEQATHDSVAFRYLSGDTHPDHDTIAHFRKRFLKELKPIFLQILLIAKEMNFLKLGTISIDGTKILANASKHKAMSWKWACKIENQLKEEVKKLMNKAEEMDENEKNETDLDIPKEIEIREKRLEKIAEAKAVLEARAKERAEREKAVNSAKKRSRRSKKKKGKGPRGRPPKEPSETPRDKDQYNFTDSESRIMKSQGTYVQAYNAQAAVDEKTMLIVANDCSNRANDKKELNPVLDKIDKKIGKPKKVLADAGYYNEQELQKCDKEYDLYVAVDRKSHNETLESRLQSPCRKKRKGTYQEIMRSKLKTPHGRKIYGKRKILSEPVFGIIKSVMGFRRFSMRGTDQASGEWSLICSAYNIKRMFSLKYAVG